MADDVQRLLLRWDAFSVADVNEVLDEYDCMISPLLDHLSDGADATFLRQWIGRARRQHFGLNPSPGADRELADALVAWWAGRQQAS